jgi:hypothetical protein
MPKLSINCIFKVSNGRRFKVESQGWDGEHDVWLIHEVNEVKHDEKVFLEKVDKTFTRSKREMDILVKEGKIIIQ